MILLPLRLASLTHKIPQRRKIIISWHAFRRMQRMIDRFEDFLVEYPFCVISVTVVQQQQQQQQQQHLYFLH